jgi:hypothetical protein
VTFEEEVEALHQEFIALLHEHDELWDKLPGNDEVYARCKAITARQKEISNTMCKLATPAVPEDDGLYPECEKLRRVSYTSNQIGEFLDWLREEKGITLCKWQDTIRHSNEIGDYTPQGYYIVTERTEQLLADFFEIDLNKVEEERLALLNELRGRNG